ncbi:MAG: hypothetical protein IPI63_02010 [Methanothrix sp.]|jgi:hypothetical protein|uniref:hypothetical protein n=1 Tax=Methanothrix sp. TaxID=90426 RepID=UPI0025D9522F|nr:hypothetical protein [Methanothrix sp.]MBK7385553.1 hypothetical protein [Methanothrix sp.]
MSEKSVCLRSQYVREQNSLRFSDANNERLLPIPLRGGAGREGPEPFQRQKLYAGIYSIWDLYGMGRQYQHPKGLCRPKKPGFYESDLLFISAALAGRKLTIRPVPAGEYQIQHFNVHK